MRRLQGEDVGDNSEEDEDIDPIETNRKSAQREAAAMERVRQYQVNRLKYYYATSVPKKSVQYNAQFDAHEDLYCACARFCYSVSPWVTIQKF